MWRVDVAASHGLIVPLYLRAAMTAATTAGGMSHSAPRLRGVRATTVCRERGECAEPNGSVPVHSHVHSSPNMNSTTIDDARRYIPRASAMNGMSGRSDVPRQAKNARYAVKSAYWTTSCTGSRFLAVSCPLRGGTRTLAREKKSPAVGIWAHFSLQKPHRPGNGYIVPPLLPTTKQRALTGRRWSGRAH